MKTQMILALVLVNTVVALVVGFFLGVNHEKRATFERMVAASVAEQNRDADTVNPRLSDKEMFGSGMTIVVPSAKGNSAHVRKINARPLHSHALKVAVENEDADTVNPHVPEADIGAEILAVNSGRHKK